MYHGSRAAAAAAAKGSRGNLGLKVSEGERAFCVRRLEVEAMGAAGGREVARGLGAGGGAGHKTRLGSQFCRHLLLVPYRRAGRWWLPPAEQSAAERREP